MDVLDLGGVAQELVALPLAVVEPVPVLAVVDPGPLDAVSRGVLDELGAGVGAEVPNALDVLVFGQVLGQVVVVPGQDVDNAAW